MNNKLKGKLILIHAAFNSNAQTATVDELYETFTVEKKYGFLAKKFESH